MRLRPCPACRRHVAIDDRTCVFCSAELAAASPAREPLARLSRAAVFVAGAAAATGCWTSKNEPKHVTAQAPAADAGVTPDAKPPEPTDLGQKRLDDDLDGRYQNHPCTSPGNGQPPVCAPYGAPPARRRLV